MVCHLTNTWTNSNLLSIGPLETNFGEIGIEIQNFHRDNALGNIVGEIGGILSRPPYVCCTIASCHFFGIVFISISQVVCKKMTVWQQPMLYVSPEGGIWGAFAVGVKYNLKSTCCFRYRIYLDHVITNVDRITNWLNVHRNIKMPSHQYPIIKNTQSHKSLVFQWNSSYRWYPAKRALPAMLTHGR